MLKHYSNIINLCNSNGTKKCDKSSDRGAGCCCQAPYCTHILKYGSITSSHGQTSHW